MQTKILKLSIIGVLALSMAACGNKSKQKEHHKIVLVDTIYSDKDFIGCEMFPPQNSGMWVTKQNKYPSPDTVCLMYMARTEVPDLNVTIPNRLAFLFINSNRPNLFAIQLPDENTSSEPVHIRFLKDDTALNNGSFSPICEEHFNYIIPLSYIYKSKKGYLSKLYILRHNLLLPGCTPNTTLDFYKLFLENQYLIMEWVDSDGEIIHKTTFLKPFSDGTLEELIEVNITH
ncbi:MAG: hypothetical protein LBD59_10820 [Prevotellaceae bacterium]|jgi:hypothetical protein|nr:hypothetical protein [Prevotellaceae bacterium]